MVVVLFALVQLVPLPGGTTARWTEAHDLFQHGSFEGAGDLWVAIFNDDPKDPSAPAALYDAAIAFEHAGLKGRAIQCRMALQKYSPNSTEAIEALRLLGEDWYSVADYSRSAQFFERFVKANPSAPESADSLARAIRFRRILGDGSDAQDDLALYLKLYRSSNPMRAARLEFEVTCRSYEVRDPSGGEEHHYLDAFLRKRPSADLALLAHVRLGQNEGLSAKQRRDHMAQALRLAKKLQQASNDESLLEAVAMARATLEEQERCETCAPTLPEIYSEAAHGTGPIAEPVRFDRRWIY